MLQGAGRFALVGKDLSCSVLKEIHKALFALSRVAASYEYIEVPPGGLASCEGKLKGLDGFDFYEEVAPGEIPHLFEVSEDVELLQAVSLIKLLGGKFKGYNTGAAGFMKALKQMGVFPPFSLCLLGAGATARTIAVELANWGTQRIVVVVQNKNLADLKLTLKALEVSNKSLQIEVKAPDELVGGVEMLVNTTRSGRNWVGKPALQDVGFVFDLACKQEETPLIRLAKSQGVRCAGGVKMALCQAVLAHKIWYGADFRPEDLERINRRYDPGF